VADGPLSAKFAPPLAQTCSYATACSPFLAVKVNYKQIKAIFVKFLDKQGNADISRAVFLFGKEKLTFFCFQLLLFLKLLKKIQIW